MAAAQPSGRAALARPADVYVAGKFALTTPVELTLIGGRIELGLGVESAGMFKRQLELRHTIAIEIANHLDSPATVEIRERIPTVPEGQDDIELSVEQVDPGWEDYEPKDPPLGRRGRGQRQARA